MKNFLLAAVALCFSFSSAASAAEAVTDENYFKQGTVTVTAEETVSDLTDQDVFPVPLRLPESKVAPAAIVNGGVQAWNVINSGAPSANLSSSYASAIPGFSFNWANYSGWKKKEVVYTYTITNLMQIDVINVKYAVSFYYNGQNLSGARIEDNPETTLSARNQIKGHYITNFTVRPLTMNIKWGWKFSLNVRMSDPMNIGTSDDPVAYLQSDLNYVVSTPFSTNGSMQTFGVDGLGNFRELTGYDKALTEKIPAVEPVEVSTISWN